MDQIIQQQVISERDADEGDLEWASVMEECRRELSCVASPVPQGCDVCNPPEVAALSLFLVTIQSRSAIALSTCRLPLIDKYRQLATYTSTGKWARRVTRHKQTHSAAEQQESQTASVHYRKIQANTVIIYPIEQHTNLTHYTALALI